MNHYNQRLMPLAHYLRGKGLEDELYAVISLTKTANPAVAVAIPSIWAKLVTGSNVAIATITAITGATYAYKEYTNRNDIYSQMGISSDDNWQTAMEKMNKYLITEDMTLGLSENFPKGQPNHILSPILGGLNNLIRTGQVTRPAVEAQFTDAYPVNLELNPAWLLDQQNVTFFFFACILISEQKAAEETVQLLVRAANERWDEKHASFGLDESPTPKQMTEILYHAAHLGERNTGGETGYMKSFVDTLMSTAQADNSLVELNEKETLEDEGLEDNIDPTPTTVDKSTSPASIYDVNY